MTAMELVDSEKAIGEGRSKRARFFDRQFGSEVTPRQLAFDVAFGIVLPVVCLYFDPIVFQSGFGTPLLGHYILVGSVATGLGLGSLAAWLLFRWPPALLAGFLAGGAVFASLLGLVMFPFSLIGLLAGIGILGFSPFVTAFVFLRNADRAYERSRSRSSSQWPPRLAALGLLISCGGPWAAHGYVTHETSRSVALAMSPDARKAQRGFHTLRQFGRVLGYDRLVYAYQAELDPARRQRMAELYQRLSGESIEDRLLELAD